MHISTYNMFCVMVMFILNFRQINLLLQLSRKKLPIFPKNSLKYQYCWFEMVWVHDLRYIEKESDIYHYNIGLVHQYCWLIFFVKETENKAVFRLEHVETWKPGIHHAFILKTGILKINSNKKWKMIITHLNHLDMNQELCFHEKTHFPHIG